MGKEDVLNVELWLFVIEKECGWEGGRRVGKTHVPVNQHSVNGHDEVQHCKVGDTSQLAAHAATAAMVPLGGKSRRRDDKLRNPQQVSQASQGGNTQVEIRPVRII